MAIKINGERIREARQFRSLTITELANEIGVSKQMVSKYEHNRSNISLDILQKIVVILKFPLSFFTNNDNGNFKKYDTFYRSRLSATQSAKQPSELYKKASAILRDYFEQYIDFPKLENFDFGNSSPANAANEIRNLWKLGNGPIQNIVAVMESHGIVVSNVNMDDSKVDANSGYFEVNGNSYYIVINNIVESNYYREQFSLAHELGHYVLHSDLKNSIQDFDKDEYRDMEKEANEFAAAFLLPKESFLNELERIDVTNITSFVPLKLQWNVSISAMVMRAYDLNFIDDKVYEKLQKAISYRKWRKNEINDDYKDILKPTVLHDAFEMLEEHLKILPNELSKKIDDLYGYYYPNEVLSQILDIELLRFKGNRVELKLK